MAYEEEDGDGFAASMGATGGAVFDDDDEEPALVKQLGGAKAIHDIVRTVEAQRTEHVTRRRVADEAAAVAEQEAVRAAQLEGASAERASAFDAAEAEADAHPLGRSALPRSQARPRHRAARAAPKQDEAGARANQPP